MVFDGSFSIVAVQPAPRMDFSLATQLSQQGNESRHTTLSAEPIGCFPLYLGMVVSFVRPSVCKFVHPMTHASVLQQKLIARKFTTSFTHSSPQIL